MKFVAGWDVVQIKRMFIHASLSSNLLGTVNRTQLKLEMSIVICGQVDFDIDHLHIVEGSPLRFHLKALKTRIYLSNHVFSTNDSISKFPSSLVFPWLRVGIVVSANPAFAFVLVVLG